MGTGDLLLGVTLQWTSTSPRGSSNTPSHLMLQRLGLSSSYMGLLGLVCNFKLPAFGGDGSGNQTRGSEVGENQHLWRNILLYQKHKEKRAANEAIAEGMREGWGGLEDSGIWPSNLQQLNKSKDNKSWISLDLINTSGPWVGHSKTNLNTPPPPTFSG